MTIKNKFTKIEIQNYKLTFHVFQNISKKTRLFFYFSWRYLGQRLPKHRLVLIFPLSLEPSKYPRRCWISFSSVLLSVVLMFPISHQAQAIANVTVPLSTEQVPGGDYGLVPGSASSLSVSFLCNGHISYSSPSTG